MASHNDFGKWAEDEAARFLQTRGYRIIDRNWRWGHKEIDIVACCGGMLVFVEVKARKRSGVWERPEMAVDSRKAHNLLRAANSYIESTGFAGDARFDVIAILADPVTGRFDIEHLEDAITPDVNWR